LDHQIARATSSAKAGNHPRAMKELDDLQKGATLSDRQLYDLACVAGLSVASAASDTQMGARERSRLVERYAAAALALLVRAREAGLFSDARKIDHLARDPDLKVLRDRADFRKFQASLKEQQRR
jgi:hypothetical protein